MRKATIDKIIAAVAANSRVTDSAVMLIKTIPALIRKAVDDDALDEDSAVSKLADAIESKQLELAAAITAGTPHADEPPVDQTSGSAVGEAIAAAPGQQVNGLDLSAGTGSTPVAEIPAPGPVVPVQAVDVSDPPPAPIAPPDPVVQAPMPAADDLVGLNSDEARIEPVPAGPVSETAAFPPPVDLTNPNTVVDKPPQVVSNDHLETSSPVSPADVPPVLIVPAAPVDTPEAKG